MVNKHLLIEAGSQVDSTARVYLVYVGTSRQANRDYLALVAHAASNGYYFSVLNYSACEFYARLRRSVPELPHAVSVKARDLVRAIKAGTRPTLEQYQLDNISKTQNLLNLNYRAAHPRG